MRTRSLRLLLLSSLVAVPVLADDVYLVNGRKFEGVIAETAGAQVRIRMQGGTLSLPKEQVLRVDAGDSNLAEYLRRKEALKKSPAARAADWLELSRWAHGKELDQAARESALAAAVLDPRLEGLAPVLRGYGYVLDPQLDRWIPYADSMRRRGLVQSSNGEWISREENAARVQAQQEQAARYYAARQEAARAAREDRLAALAELSVVRQLAQPPQPPYSYPYPIYGTPVLVSPGGGGEGHHRPPFRQDPSPGFTHIPGSLSLSEGSHVPGSLIPGDN